MNEKTAEKLAPLFAEMDKRYVSVSEHKDLSDKYEDVLRQIAEMRAAPAFISQESRERGNTKPEFSLGRLTSAYIRRKLQGDFNSDARFEHENEYIRKAFASGTTTAGGFLIPEDWQDSVINQLAAQAVVLKAGPNIIPVTKKKMHLPAISADATAQWLGENAAITESTPPTAEVTLTLSTAKLLSAFSLEWMEYSSPQVDAAFQNNLVAALQRFVDAGFLTGSGANRPTGLRSISSPTLVGAQNGNANGGNLAYGDLINLLDGLDGANVGDVKRTWFMNPRSFTRVRSLVDTTNRPLFYSFETPLVDRAPSTLLGYPYYKTTQLPKNETKGTGTNLSAILCVDMADVYVGVGAGGEGIRIDVSEHAGFANAQIQLRLLFQADIQPGHTASVGIIDGVA